MNGAHYPTKHGCIIFQMQQLFKLVKDVSFFKKRIICLEGTKVQCKLQITFVYDLTSYNNKTLSLTGQCFGC